MQRALTLVCLYGFLVDMKPSEPYLNEFLTIEKGFSNQQTNTEIYPYWTYGQLLLLLLVPSLAERYGTYRRVLILESIGFLLTRILLLYGTSLFHMQLMQIVYAIGTATKVVYYAYIYQLVEPRQYREATSSIWGAQAAGQFVAGILAQLLYNEGKNLYLLNYISTISVFLSFGIVLSLPETRDRVRPVEIEKQHPPLVMVSWILAMGCSNMLQNYIQNDWNTFGKVSKYNGIVMSGYTLFGTVATVLPTGFKQSNVCILTAFVGMALLMWLITYSKHISTSYIGFGCYGGLFYFAVPVLTSQIAETSANHDYAATLGRYLFISTLCQTIVTFVLAHSTTHVWFVAISVFQTVVALLLVVSIAKWEQLGSKAEKLSLIRTLSCS